MKLFLITFFIILLSFAGIAIKLLLKKNGEFSGTCASNNPMFQNDEGGCSYCGASKDEVCKKGDIEETSPVS